MDELVEGPSVLKEIASEYELQRRKFGVATHPYLTWCSILQEKLGGISRSALNCNFYRGSDSFLRQECIRMAVICMQIVEAVDSNNANGE